MTSPAAVSFVDVALDQLAETTGKIAVFVPENGQLGLSAKRINRLTRGAIKRFAESDMFAKMSDGDAREMHMPTGLVADSVIVVRLPRRPSVDLARKAGVSIAKLRGAAPVVVTAGSIGRAEEIAMGVVLRGYSFDDHKTNDSTDLGAVTVMVAKPADVEAKAKPLLAIADGVFFTRDLVTEPANILTTTEFASRLVEMEKIGLKVNVLEEPELEKLGMGSLLCVGQGSDSPSKVAIMEWNGGGDEAPFALVGKGVVFDTGGISLKPAAGMEDMTMDMGGAGVVAGTMRALALRKAKANVVGLVGLVENMPSGNATRPGDVVTSMKGDTIEVINTDAEGRLVLADVLWYAQETYKPVGMINLATLTGAIIIGLGHENAGVFSNDDKLCGQFLKAADAEGEGAWRMPLAKAYDDLLKSNVADMKNIGGRAAGSITAGQFLQRFVQEDQPWIHLDIAGVASVKAETAYAPKGATGWGVMSLNRLIADNYEA